MNRDNDRQTSIILSMIGILPVVWLGLLIAPSVKGGLPEILPSLMNVMSDPFHIELCDDSVKTVLVLLLCYGMGIGIYFSTRRNYRRREEHGSAKWGNAKAVDKKYRQNPPSENKLMTQNVRIGFNGKKHRRNLNTLVCGGSGAGKTRFYCKPNLMQANTSFVILDPKGEIVRDVGNLLEKRGYEIRVLDLISMEKSHCYNPFVYLHSDTMYSALSPICLRAPPRRAVSPKTRFGIPRLQCCCLRSSTTFIMKRRRMNRTLQWLWRCYKLLPSTMRKILDLHRWTACFPTWSWTDPTTSL